MVSSTHGSFQEADIISRETRERWVYIVSTIIYQLYDIYIYIDNMFGYVVNEYIYIYIFNICIHIDLVYTPEN